MIDFIKRLFNPEAYVKASVFEATIAEKDRATCRLDSQACNYLKEMEDERRQYAHTLAAVLSLQFKELNSVEQSSILLKLLDIPDVNHISSAAIYMDMDRSSRVKVDVTYN